MAYYVKKSEPKSLPVFGGTFQQVVKWCLKAQKEGLLSHPHYEIHGSELKNDPAEFVCDFFADDFAGDLL